MTPFDAYAECLLAGIDFWHLENRQADNPVFQSKEDMSEALLSIGSMSLSNFVFPPGWRLRKDPGQPIAWARLGDHIFATRDVMLDGRRDVTTWFRGASQAGLEPPVPQSTLLAGLTYYHESILDALQAATTSK